jgi:betaine-aldehyde dehydrogenase
MSGQRHLRNFIGGEYVDGRTDSTTEIINPATGSVVATAPVSGQEDVDAAYAAAEQAFAGEWGATTPSERQQALLKFADAVEAHADELIALESENTGKIKPSPRVRRSRRWSTSCASSPARPASSRAGPAEYMPVTPRGSAANRSASSGRSPRGTTRCSWRSGRSARLWRRATASSSSRATPPPRHPALAELASQFLPAGTLNVITGDRDTGRMLVEHRTPSLVAITGSVRAGAEVAASAAPNIKRVHLELGGKAPVVVFDDADIEAAVEGIAVAGYFNAGQDCTAATRVLVAPGVHDDFVAALAEYARTSAPVGLPDDEDALFGPVNNSPAGSRLRLHRPAALPRDGLGGRQPPHRPR